MGATDWGERGGGRVELRSSILGYLMSMFVVRSFLGRSTKVILVGLGPEEEAREEVSSSLSFSSSPPRTRTSFALQPISSC